jgi:hypothetical protein
MLYRLSKQPLGHEILQVSVALSAVVVPEYLKMYLLSLELDKLLPQSPKLKQ